jgi:hypothetical protein
MNEEEAIHYIIHFLRNPIATKYNSYGYDFYLPGIRHRFLKKQSAIEVFIYWGMGILGT